MATEQVVDVNEAREAAIDALYHTISDLRCADFDAAWNAVHKAIAWMHELPA